MCPYYLDGDNCHIPRRPRSQVIEDYVSLEHAAGLSLKRRRAEIAMQFSKIAEEAVARVSHDGLSKLNSMLGRRRRPKAPGLVWVAAQVRSTFQADRACPARVNPRKTKSRRCRQERFRSGSSKR
jgi:hypothetical protein